MQETANYKIRQISISKIISQKKTCVNEKLTKTVKSQRKFLQKKKSNSKQKEEKPLLNTIWPIFIVLSFVYAIATGRIEQINNSIFSSAASAVELSITFLGTMCLWNGIMKIAQTTSLTKKLSKTLKPLIHFLFPEVKNNNIVQEEIAMNMIANILGLGNAATPLGLKAMSSMQKENPKKDTLTHAMCMFIIINTASIQLIPTTVIAIRTSLKSANPTQIILPVWVATICAATAGITCAKICSRRKS